MGEIVEVDERGAIQLPADLLAVVKPHTRYVLEVQDDTLVLHPLPRPAFWQTATPQERAEAVRRWAALERPIAPPLPDAALHREQMYD